MGLGSVEMGFWLMGIQCINVPRLASEHVIPTLLKGWMQQIVFKLLFNSLLERSTFTFACRLLFCRVDVGSKRVGTTSTGWDADPTPARSLVAACSAALGCVTLFVTSSTGRQSLAGLGW